MGFFKKMITDASSIEQFLGMPIWLFIIVAVWTLIWKGISMWKAAKLNNRTWFMVLLVVNTLGILEILYYYVFSEMVNYKGEEESQEKKVKRRVRKKKRE
jgi:hypothetical protein